MEASSGEVVQVKGLEAPRSAFPPIIGGGPGGPLCSSSRVTESKPQRVVVTWELAQGVASVLRELAWWLGARAERSRILESALRSALDPTSSRALPARRSR